MTTSRSSHLVDPQLLPFLESLPMLELSAQTLAPARSAMAQPGPALPECRPVTTTRRTVPGPAGDPDVKVVIHRPDAAEPVPAILHMHGGGYVMGSPEAEVHRHRQMAAELGCCIVSVDYRLAPETVFPGAIEDCCAALAWLFANSDALGVEPARVGVMGESAGGGLAAALALMARDRGLPRLAFQHLIYPMLDDRTGQDGDPHAFEGEFLWTAHNNRFGWRALLGERYGGQDVPAYAAAARARDLAGLPPAFIATGALDLFLEEDLDYARRLARAGVALELHVYPGGFHGFDYAPDAGVAVQARGDSRAALARALGTA